MAAEIHTISLALPLGMGKVNCYLIKTEQGQVLIDTGGSNTSAVLLRELEAAGSRPGSLKLVVLTHGDFDHIGGAAALRKAYGAPLAMHSADADSARRGDMFTNRKRPNFIVRGLVPLLMRFGKDERFEPDLLLDDGFDLKPYGLEAVVRSIPGHSKGSLGVLTSAGELFCGDLFENEKEPGLNGLMDDPAAGRISLARLAEMNVKMVYPGHGQPFGFEKLADWLP